MRDADHDRVVTAARWELGKQFKPVLPPGFIPVDPRVVDIDCDGKLAEFRDEVDDAAYARHKAALGALLTGAYQMGGAPAERAMTLAATAVDGLADAAIVNLNIEAGRAALPEALRDIAAIDVTDAALLKGLPYALFGKGALFGSIGSRYLVVARHYDLWAEHRAPWKVWK